MKELEGVDVVEGVDLNKGFKQQLDNVFAQSSLNIDKALGLSETVALQTELNLLVAQYNADHTETLEVSDLINLNKEKLIQKTK